MSGQERVRRLYRFMNAGDVAGAAQLLDPDAEWIPDSRAGERPTHVSGAPFEIRIAHLWTVRGGLIVRGEGYGNRSEALDVAGVHP